MVMAISRFEWFFRAAGGVDVDKSDLKRFEDFIHEEIHRMLERAVSRGARRPS